MTFRFWYCRFYDWRERKLCANFQMEKKTSMEVFFFYMLFNFWFIYLNKAYLTLYILTYLQFINLFPWNCFHIQKQAYIGVLRKKVFWKYAVNLQENTQAKVWFQTTTALLKSHFSIRCSPVNLLRIFRTPFPKNTSGRLLLNVLIQVLGQFFQKWAKTSNAINFYTVFFSFSSLFRWK